MKTLSERLSAYTFEFIILLRRPGFFLHTEEAKNPTASDFERIEEKLVDFWVYFKENEQFLPEEIAEQVGKIYSWMKFLHEIAYENLPKLRYNEITIYHQSVKHELFNFHRLTNKHSREEWEELDYDQVFGFFIDDIMILDKDMQELSRSGSL